MVRRSVFAIVLAASTAFVASTLIAPAASASLLSAAAFPQCSTVSWSYASSTEPAGATGFRADLLASLDLLSHETGLTFVEAADPFTAQIRYSFANLSSSGLATADGAVIFNADDAWVSDARAGFATFAPFKKGKVRYLVGPAGRGWLIVHETLHVLGLTHVNDRTSLMSPVNRGQGMSASDRDAIRALYRCGA